MKISTGRFESYRRALAYNALVEDFGLTHNQISEIVGKDRATITNSLRLLKLPERIKQMLISGELNSGQARCSFCET